MEANIELPALKIRPLPVDFFPLSDRNITKATAEKYRVTVIQDPGENLRHVYPYFDKDGQHVSNKNRYKGKGFSVEGELHRSTLFGQQLFPPKSAKAITITEGECDAMAAFEMQGSKYPCVSVKGASSAARDCKDNWEYLNSFETIVVCFDKDDAKVNPKTGKVHYPGQEAALAVAEMFPVGKVKLLTLREYKDANDYLLYGKGREYIKEWWDAPTHIPGGLKHAKSMWDEIVKPRVYETVPYPWAGLNHLTYGIRLSEMVILTADTKIGKTTIIKEIVHHLLKNSSANIGLMMMEEPNYDTCLGLMSITANKPLHLPDVRATVSDVELRSYFDSTLNNERIVVWDHFGSTEIHAVLDKVRHMAALGCKYIVLDHLSILVSDQSGDERKQLDEVATKLKTLCIELNIALIAVIHQNRNGQIRGTAGVEQLANMVIKLYRDMKDPNEWRRNVTKLAVEANRFCGRSGPASYVHYDGDTGRLKELDPETAQAFEEGKVVETWG